MSSTAVKVTWEIRKNNRFIEGFHIHYRTIAELDSHSAAAKSFATETVQSSSATMYTLHNLEKDSWYEIHIQPFYLSVVGQASNSIRVKTLEDSKCILFFSHLFLYFSLAYFYLRYYRTQGMFLMDCDHSSGKLEMLIFLFFQTNYRLLKAGCNPIIVLLAIIKTVFKSNHLLPPWQECNELIQFCSFDSKWKKEHLHSII